MANKRLVIDANIVIRAIFGTRYGRLAELIGAHRTTLVFVNTRRLAERVTRHLSKRLGEENVAARTTAAWPRNCGSTPRRG